MTISKNSWSDTNKGGLWQKETYFTHGQLYVAASRVEETLNIFILLLTRPLGERLGMLFIMKSYRQVRWCPLRQRCRYHVHC